MQDLLTDSAAFYAKSPDQAEALLASTGEAPRNKQLPSDQVAGTLVMIRALLGSDSFVLND
jgi:hypothetical protein